MSENNWRHLADLEARFGLGPGCPPTMNAIEMAEFDSRQDRHWFCNIGDTLAEDYFACSSYWAESYDPETHAPRFFLRSFIGPSWERIK